MVSSTVLFFFCLFTFVLFSFLVLENFFHKVFLAYFYEISFFYLPEEYFFVLAVTLFVVAELAIFFFEAVDSLDESGESGRKEKVAVLIGVFLAVILLSLVGVLVCVVLPCWLLSFL